MKIQYLIIHCTATEQGRDYTVADIDRWHKQRGFKKIGYHYLIRLDGTIEKGRLDTEIGAHCRGKNDKSLGICYVGGLKNGKPFDTRTREQNLSLECLVKKLVDKNPGVKVAGHNQYANKSCPCFDVPKWWDIVK